MFEVNMRTVSYCGPVRGLECIDSLCWSQERCGITSVSRIVCVFCKVHMELHTSNANTDRTSHCESQGSDACLAISFWAV